MAMAVRNRVHAEQQNCEGYDCKSSGTVPRSLCLSCGSSYCDVCWNRQGPHRPGKVGMDGLPHEKTDKRIYERLRAILEPPEDAEELSRLHIEDEDTTWFGVEKNASGQPVFYDYGRYAALMAETKQPNSSVRYPQLVAFVGQTGAGKSTLINMLVSLKEKQLAFGSDSPFKAPVAGSVKNDKSPTSGDVHLYIDPCTAYGPLPLLYADCEGLEGGEVPPRASQIRETRRRQGQRVQNPFKSSPRELVYAKTNSETKNREWAVKKMYPRLLYTFSDVVVFVLRNARTFESGALRLLLDWASTSLESSLNQPTLPHAVIVLNATSTSVDEEEWDVITATKNLMQHVGPAIYEQPWLKSLAEHWRRKGKQIDTTIDLIRCYYTDIAVVRIPIKGRYMLAHQQIDKLHERIVKDCDASFKAKNDAHMLSNADELHSYLQAGFDHFASREDQPFNFVEVALKNNPIPRDFGDHILGLAAKVQEVTGIKSGPDLLERLSLMIATCIFIDCIREHRPGRAADLFDQFYAASCTAALEHFCQKYWPCSYVSRKGKACVNVKTSHNVKGHQDAKGKIFATGPYASKDFSSALFDAKWKKRIKEQLKMIDNELLQAKSSTVDVRTDDLIALKIHRINVDYFWRTFFSFGAHHFMSLTTCLCCCMEVPQHPLQCGHILCTPCLKAYGVRTDQHSVVMKFCPLHMKDTEHYPDWPVHFKPDFAGVRILTLDGGGMRGIVELEVLRSIEQALGGKMELQAFFDLIIGTSTGGILALGLGVKQWSVSHCITEFVRLCDQAFTPREFSSVAGFRQATTLKHGSKYKSQPLRYALESSFGRDRLYGGRRTYRSMYDTKVAVTATSGTGQQPILLANYSRQEENEPNYKFEFPHELRVWEAASATSAAPSFFKPFEAQTRPPKTYLDGAIYHNNPVRVANHERRFLWPDVADSAPDILLSVGTGQNGFEISKELEKEAIDRSVLQQPRQAETKPGKVKSMLTRKGKKDGAMAVTRKGRPFGVVTKFFEVLVNRIDKILDAEREWRMFCADAIGGKKNDEDVTQRYVRFNVDLGKDPPALDDKMQLPNLQASVANILKSAQYQVKIEKIANQLVASSFYFIKEDTQFEESSGEWLCTGRIVCRFEGSSTFHRNNMRSLGEFMRTQQRPGYQPFFSIKETRSDPDHVKMDISQFMIEDMIARAEFRLCDRVDIVLSTQLSPIMIYLSLCETQKQDPELYPISGFPRHLAIEDSLNETRLDKRAELIRARRYNTLAIANDPKLNAPFDSGSDLTQSADPGPSESMTLTSSNGSVTTEVGSGSSLSKRVSNDAKMHSRSPSGALKERPPGPSPAHSASHMYRPRHRMSLQKLRRSLSVTDLRAKSQSMNNSTLEIQDAEVIVVGNKDILTAATADEDQARNADIYISSDSDGPVSDDES